MFRNIEEIAIELVNKHLFSASCMQGRTNYFCDVDSLLIYYPSHLQTQKTVYTVHWN
jgi:hypothetical protein